MMTVQWIHLTSILLIAPCATGAWAQEEVVFPDPNLEAVLREAINKPAGALSSADFAELTELDARERGISDLTGTEQCGNLYEVLADG